MYFAFLLLNLRENVRYLVSRQRTKSYEKKNNILLHKKKIENLVIYVEYCYYKFGNIDTFYGSSMFTL